MTSTTLQLIIENNKFNNSTNIPISTHTLKTNDSISISNNEADKISRIINIFNNTVSTEFSLIASSDYIMYNLNDPNIDSQYRNYTFEYTFIKAGTYNLYIINMPNRTTDLIKNSKLIITVTN